MHQHHQPSPTTPCFTKSFSKSGQVRFDNSFVEYSSVNRADIPNTRLSPTRLKPYRLMSINRGLFGVPPGDPTQQSLFRFRAEGEVVAKNHRRPRASL